MTGKERVTAAMRHEATDRVPVFCQLAIGHYMRHCGRRPEDIWYSSEALSSAYVEMARAYRFDGILVNLPGRPADWERHVVARESEGGDLVLVWDEGGRSVVPPNDNVHYSSGRPRPKIEEVDPDSLFYIEPHNITELKSPFYYDFGDYASTGSGESFFPPYLLDSLRSTVVKAGAEFHVSSEVFSPFTQLMELLGYTEALMAIMDEPALCEKILARLAEGASTLAGMQARAGADSILISSAFAGGGFISRETYEGFVLPYEKAVVEETRLATGLPVYVHTCGKIGDRIDLMLCAGYDGVDTMDPPPLGDSDILAVKEKFGDRLFLKGNVDPVNVLLGGRPEDARREAERLIRALARGSGYILSSACSVSPEAPPENILALSEASLALSPSA